MENKNEIKNLNENEVEKVAGGTLTDEELEKAKQKPPHVKKLSFGGYPSRPSFLTRVKCRVCGKPLMVLSDLRGCNNYICGECAKKEREEEGKAKTQ